MKCRESHYFPVMHIKLSDKAMAIRIANLYFFGKEVSLIDTTIERRRDTDTE